MDRRRWLLLLSVVIIAAVAILASSLHDVHFAPGHAIAEQQSPSGTAPLVMSEPASEIPLWKLFVFWGIFVAGLALFFFLLPPDLRKKILQRMISMALTILAILLAIRYRLMKLPLLDQQPPTQLNAVNTVPQGGVLAPPFQPPQMTPWWVFLISFVVLALLLTLLWLAYRWWLRPGRGYSSGLDAIGAIARTSLDELASGRDWTNVIIQSYVRMGEAVSLRRGLQRAAAATPREFAQRLEGAGLPAHAVQRLTRLFESARYGAKASSQADVNEAVACLNSILQACGQSQ